jgi:hypothetical protein
MTEEEARALKPGDRVEIGDRRLFCPGLPRAARVTGFAANERGELCVRIRRDGPSGDGLTPSGKVRQPEVFHHSYLRRLPALPPIPANVYADWLDEQGEHRAAALLREAFPLGPLDG